MSTQAELRAREEEVEREWQWLHDALNTIARARAERGDAAAFRLMQIQAMIVGQRRFELRAQMAELEGPRRRAHEARHARRYPYPIVQVACRHCKRRGRYRKETLIATYGAQAELHQVLLWLSADCALSANRISRPGCFGAYLPDLETKRR